MQSFLPSHPSFCLYVLHSFSPNDPGKRWGEEGWYPEIVAFPLQQLRKWHHRVIHIDEDSQGAGRIKVSDALTAEVSHTKDDPMSRWCYCMIHTDKDSA